MVMSPAASLPGQDNGSLIGEADLLPRHPVFRARDLEPAREYLSGVLAPHRLAYLTREHRLNFRHRRAKLGAVELNALQFGGDVMVTAPHIPDYFLLQFTLAGSCTLAQGGRTYDMRFRRRHQSLPALHEKLVARWPPAPAPDRSELAGARNACLDRARPEGAD
jgi:hypothetical protein